MKPTIYILGLALVLLFFAGCGEKEEDLDDQLLSKSKNIVFAKSTEKAIKDSVINKTETINAKIDRGIILRGNAIRSNGMIISNFTFHASPRGLYEKTGNPGHINTNITTDENGFFEIGGLLPEHYKFKISTDEANSITTNVVLYSDEENYMEFVFPDFQFQNVIGIVIYESSEEPAPGIEIKCSMKGCKKIITTTDANGEFEVSLPFTKRHGSILKINEPGHAKVRYVLNNYAGETVKILLRETGILVGTIITESGRSVSRVRLVLRPESPKDKSSKTSFSDHDSQWRNTAASEESKYPSNANGEYVISNVVAPQIYRIELRGFWNGNFRICNKNRKVKIEPGETTVYNIKLRKTDRPNVKVKVKDKDGNSLLNYSLEIESKNKNGATSSGLRNVNLSQSNDWYRVRSFIREGNGTLDLTVKTDDRRIAKKKNIPIKTDKDNKIILILSEPQQPIVSGFVYKPDLTPYIDGYINGYIDTDHGQLNYRGKIDHFGYFEIIGMNVEKGTKINLSAWINYVMFYTNALAGDDNIEWILPKPKCITGRVCIKNNTTPATNFAISILRPSDKQVFSSMKGSFSFQVGNFKIQPNSKIQVYAFVQGYAPTIKEIDYKLDKSNIFNIGDLIVVNKPATIKGRVINHEFNPLRASVSLRNNNNHKRYLDCKADNDGKFEMTDIPPGEYFIEARTRHNSVKSDPFDLHSDETYELSNLMIFETNVFPVTFKFIFQDGTPAAYAHIGYFDKRTDDRGILTEKIYPLNFGKWSVKTGHKWHDSEEIIIKKDTRELTVKVTCLPSFSGTVTLNDKPLKFASLRFDNGNDCYLCRANYGEFKVNALPGKYTVTCPKQKISAIIELSETAPNKINFKK